MNKIMLKDLSKDFKKAIEGCYDIPEQNLFYIEEIGNYVEETKDGNIEKWTDIYLFNDNGKIYANRKSENLDKNELKIDDYLIEVIKSEELSTEIDPEKIVPSFVDIWEIV